MKLRYEIIIVVLILAISAVAHGFNMFDYPYYENDEGTYMSQAWSLIEEGKLAPYTYWYDHVPFGWIMIAGWVHLTGGMFAFGDAVASGRVFMLVLHIATTFFLYFSTKRLSGSVFAAVIASLIFSLSPMGIYYQRRVLLDNIMIFWLFAALALLVKEKLKMRHIFLSGLASGLAVVSKENAVIFAPVYLYIIFIKTQIANRLFSIILWLAIMGVVVVMYPLYAMIKGEFLPPGPGEEHVSLVQTLSYHMTRGTDAPFWDPSSEFYNAFLVWIAKDPFIMIAGIFAATVVCIFALWHKPFRVPALFTLFAAGFLARGGLILDFYIVSLSPFLAMCIGMLLHEITWSFSMHKKSVYAVLSTIGLAVVLLLSTTFSTEHYTAKETDPQLKAVQWVKENLPADSHVVIDNAIYMELRNPDDGPVFHDADWFWKVERDDEIRKDKFNEDWRNIDYIIASHEFYNLIRRFEIPFVREAMDHADVIEQWGPNSSGTHVNYAQYISTNGDWAAIYKIKEDAAIEQDAIWDRYKGRFLRSYGQVIEPYQNDRTTSEAQSYAMLRSVYADDQNMFDGVWAWTQDHLQHRADDKLLSWLWAKDESGEYGIADAAVATDADTDAAMALLFAYQKWGEERYREDALELIDALWEQAVLTIGDEYYMGPSTRPNRDSIYLYNPSYFSPAAYRMFAEVDPEHDWEYLIRSGYALLDTLRGGAEGTTLPANWITLNQRTGTVGSARKYLDANADLYGYDGFRVLYRVAQDAAWYDEKRAFDYLRSYVPFITQAQASGEFYAEYTTSGTPFSEKGSPATEVGFLAALTVVDPVAARDVFDDRIAHVFNSDGSYWGDENDYYTQNWAWFGTALYKNDLPNLWPRE